LNWIRIRDNEVRLIGVYKLILLLLGCITEKEGLAVLGYSDEKESVLLTQIADSSDGLNIPRDLGFNPDEEGQLWIVNRADDSVTILFDAGTSSQQSQHLIDPYAEHFMEEVSSITFGDTGTFGTCQESRNTYNGFAPGDDFMGPTLWSSDLDIFANSNPEAVGYLTRLYGEHTDLGSHLDMLHENPLCMGIEWQTENIYWVFDGNTGSITRNNFHVDHGVGFDDHTDGVIGRYVEGEVLREPDVPSHLKFGPEHRFLYIVDSGNNAIKKLDIYSGETGDYLPVTELRTVHYMVDDAAITTVINGEDHDMEVPSGITIINGIIFITDNKTGVIFAFDMDGILLDTYNTGLDEGALMGIYGASEDDLWFVDAVDNAVYRLQPDGAQSNQIPSNDEYTVF
jgi:hypothetical protein